MTFFIEVKFESCHTTSNEGIEIEEIQNFKHMSIQIKIMDNNTANLFFFFFFFFFFFLFFFFLFFFRFLNHCAQINWGSKCKECKISRFLVNKFLILVVVI